MEQKQTLNPIKPTQSPKANDLVEPIQPVQRMEPVQQKELNADLDLSQFDYKNLTGKAFEDYQALEDILPMFEHRDFVQYMASGVFKTILDDNADKKVILVGIKINNDSPVSTTRIPVKVAKEFNAQIMNRDNPPSNSRYLLLKKPGKQ